MTNKNICKLTFNGKGNDDCGGRQVNDRPSKISFAVENSNLSEKDLQKKQQIKEELFQSIKKCVDEGKCEGLYIKALRWDKCEVCDEHLPYLREKVIDPMMKSGIPVKYEELDAKKDGGNLFTESGCQGTPCVLIRDPNTKKFKKAYDGRQMEIGAISRIAGLPNPLFYGDLDDTLPQNILKKDASPFIINNSRSNGSMWL